LITNLDDLCSDHSSVLLTIDNASLFKPKKPNLNQGRMDWEKFKLSLENKTNLKINLKSTDDIDKSVNLLTKSIQESA
jgi:hypothetical protein